MLQNGDQKFRVKLYKHKKLWVAMGVTTTMLALGVVPMTPAHAATTTNATAEVTSAASTTSQSATSQAASATASTAAASSATTESTATSTGSVAPSQADQATSTPASAATSATSQATSTASQTGSATAATSTASMTATSVTPASQTSAVSATSSTPASSAATQTTATATTSAATQTTTTGSNTATSPVRSRAALMKAATPAATADTTTPSDDTVVTIADANLSNAIKTGLGLATTADITVGDLRNYNTLQGNLVINTDTTPVATLAGIESLKYFTTKRSIELTLRIATPQTKTIDLSELGGLNISRLIVEDTYMSYVNLQGLTAIDPTNISYVDLDAHDGEFQGHQYGMTNAQLKQLGPWLTAIGNNNVSQYIGLTNNCLTDFSPLSGITKSGAYIAAIGQMVVRANDPANPINVVANQTATFTGMTITGVQGETINDAFGYSFNNTKGIRQPITVLGNNQYQIDNIQQLTNTPGYLVYGNLGMPYTTNWTSSAQYVFIEYANGVKFSTDMMIYQKVNFQAYPSVTIKYVDQNVQPIAGVSDQVVAGTNIGDSYDLSSYKSVDNYITYATSGTVTGTFTQDPQTFYVMLIPKVAAGNVTVNYVDTKGNILSTDTATYPNGQYVSLSYQTTAKKIAGYTFSQMGTDSLAANGTLTADGGTVTYVYTKDPVAQGQFKVTYIDDTTGETLQSLTLSGDQGAVSDYATAATIAQYVARGYQLVSDDVPSTGATYPTTATAYTVHLQHGQQAVTAADQLQKVVTRTIHFVTSDGQTLVPDQVATVKFTRTGQLDMVTLVPTYSAWQPATGQFTAVTVPTIDGYTADQTTVPATTVTPTSADLTTTVTYTAVPVIPTDPDDGNNGGTTTTPTDPDPDNNGGTTTTPGPDDNGTLTNPDGDGDQLNPGTSVTVKPTTPVKTVNAGHGDPKAPTSLAKAKPTNVDDGQAATIQPKVATKSVMPTTKSVSTPAVTMKATATALKPVVTPATKSSTLPQTDERASATGIIASLGVLLMTVLTAIGLKPKRREQ
ncbi:mucin-binding protein [Lactiplantibacillus daowaiensis]|uniref:MucBP domain-containing protein n=1 Tax=Lactiplantibacillus daowaiensis TaxID=2559918 RepID=A0ABW1S2R0_9LACO|nr:MucBP domain-containing protein [Lactiplantibacillus daowaiensis]